MLARSSARVLAAAQPQASSAVAALYATGRDQSLGDKVKETVDDAAGTNSSEPSVMEKMREGVGKVTEKVGQMFKEDGSVGHQFTPDGKAGGTAQEVGGPFDKEGSVGHQFTTDGGIGGTVEKAAETVEDKGQDMQKRAQQNQGKEQTHDPSTRKL
ncbi:hypothetical protein OEZ86_010783 [Tetradesmus obliquus]|nr:hypothetical protein OEZ86_010783 [Tetradesmus obliquus]